MGRFSHEHARRSRSGARGSRYNGRAPIEGPPWGEGPIRRERKRILFELFLISGFCGLLYQVVWLRLAFAAFGIITPVLSVVVSVFMLGLGIGAWIAGRASAAFTRRTGRSAIFLYAAIEFTIGIGAFAVPPLFHFGASLLRGMGETNSVPYLALSGLAIGTAIVPWCLAMGATFPAMMAYVREDAEADPQSFSYLYLANVVGASLGALLTACVLVEVMGFRHTLWTAGLVNFAIAAVAIVLGLQSPSPARIASEAPNLPTRAVAPGWSLAILFTTGFAALGMEVVWARSFMPVLGTQVYAFAALLVTYLLATWIGSWRYRSDLARGRVAAVPPLVVVVAVCAFLPAVLPDPRLLGGAAASAIALASIVPLCASLGYLTPRLVDDVSAGHPRLAGNAYAVNVLGCILGPLLASYVLLPFLGATGSIVLLAAPIVVFAVVLRGGLSTAWRTGGAVVVAGLVAWIFVAGESYENPCDTSSRCEIRRDYTATVVAQGEGMKKRLLVNGIGITGLTPITKYMAHLPLAMHTGEAHDALVICFGMGTTYRSLLSWGLQTTAVELVPSVRDSFLYFHDDAAQVLANPKGRIVVDDGRRFLERTSDKYDVIVVDPPPPVEAAGSSLLYSREFHAAVRRHLKPGGVFQTWFPFGEPRIAAAIASSLTAEFPYVRAYRGIDGWGVHFIASMEPIPDIDAQRMVARLPPAALRDIGEWSTNGAAKDAQTVLSSQMPIASLMPSSPAIRITDDRPYNEYYLVRRMVARP